AAPEEPGAGPPRLQASPLARQTLTSGGRRASTHHRTGGGGQRSIGAGPRRGRAGTGVVAEADRPLPGRRGRTTPERGGHSRPPIPDPALARPVLDLRRAAASPRRH